jgi:alpha-tubulin suppressor-like RCC1 family protein
MYRRGLEEFPQFVAVLHADKTHITVCGANHSGQLGTGDEQQRNTFCTINLPVAFTCISTGLVHCLAVAEIDGALWSWGSNIYNQLGLIIDPLLVNTTYPEHNEIMQVSKPTQIKDTQYFHSVHAGYDFSLALGLDGSVWSFGIAISCIRNSKNIPLTCFSHNKEKMWMDNLGRATSVPAKFLPKFHH